MHKTPNSILTEEHSLPGLPRRTVRIFHGANAVQLYFPPLRAPDVALALGLFGLACLTLPLFAIAGLVPAGGSTAHGLLMLALLGAFVVPFPVFGAVFVALAVYMLANSLTVRVDRFAIHTTRRVFGFGLKRAEIRSADVAALEPQIVKGHQSLFGSVPYFRLVARHGSQRKKDLVVAESLRGEAMMSQVRAMIAHHAGIEIGQHE